MKKNKGFTLIKLHGARKRAFTLIELLVVIAIISILATIMVVAYTNAQAKTRDNRRKSDVQSVASAFKIYNQETKSWTIPNTGFQSSGLGLFRSDHVNGYVTSIAHGLENGNYIDSSPQDPSSSQDYVIGLCKKGSTPIGLKILADLEIDPTNADDIAYAREGNRGGCDSVDYSDPSLSSIPTGNYNFAVIVK